MGRPIKSGLDYFPLDTKNDDKLDLIEAKFGIQGYGIIIKLWSRIYRGEGYYTPWTEREQLLFSKEINVDINAVDTCLMYALKIGIFDSIMYKKGVLTSRGIQKRFIEASKRRHEITFYSDLLLVNVDIIPVNVSNKPRSLCFNVYSGTHIEIENEIEIKKKEDDQDNATEEAQAMADLLYDLHAKNIDKGFNKSIANIKKWAYDIDKINRLDGRSWADIKAIIIWVKTPGNFWASNIMSGSKLREKFPTLIAQQKPAPTKPPEREIKGTEVPPEFMEMWERKYGSKKDREPEAVDEPQEQKENENAEW